MAESIVEIAGGLGNQMFQYAYFKKLQQLGHHCKLYFDNNQSIHNGYELDRVFGIQAPFASESEVNKLLDKDQSSLSKIKRKLYGYNPCLYWEHDKGYQYKPELLALQKGTFLQGCWLSEKYFSDIESEIRDAFIFQDLDAENLKIFEQIRREENPVSVHIRLGDYLKSAIHKNIDYEIYLREAISILKQKIVSPHFYVFSDDVEEAQNIFGDMTPDGVTYISWNKGKRSFHDMHLMSCCRHNIITNSTFSWWGGWLNNYKEKIVISPKDWFTINEWSNNSIIPDSWIAI